MSLLGGRHDLCCNISNQGSLCKLCSQKKKRNVEPDDQLVKSGVVD